jgi:hypothetical protein
MRKRGFLPAVAAFLCAILAGCQVAEPEAVEPVPQPSPAPVATPAQAAPQGNQDEATVPVASPAAAPAAARVIASQESNWPGIVADVTEFRRKGSTLTARVVFRNQGSEAAEPDLHYNQAYVMDLDAGKKYEVLRDEKGAYIAALHTGYGNRWYQKLQPGARTTIWMKFPAPPPEVKSATLQLPGLPPFEDLPIQDS